jgi:exopolysaccharide biosynthesis WecB/TagA/CpsF family protein
VIDYGKRSLLGVGVDAVDHDAAVDRILYFARKRRPYLVSALAVHGLVEAHRDQDLRSALNDYDLVVPDGQPLCWGLNLAHGLDLQEKVPGPSLTEALLAAAADEGLTVFLYGSTTEVLDRIVHAARERYGDSLRLLAQPSRFAPVEPAELREIAEEINASGANLCLVGLGCPRQERFVAAAGPMLRMPSLAVGAAFDYLAGDLRRASPRTQRLGLEWVYRLRQEPRRLAGRYTTTNSRFVVALGAQVARERVLRQPPRGWEPARVQWAQIDA